MKRNGFTLIELLAVIVILAIIALIAVPIVLNIINNSKESAQLRSAEMYTKAVHQAVVRKNMKGEFSPKECILSNEVLTCDGNELTVEIDGEVPTSATITFDENGITEAKLNYSNGKTIERKAETGKFEFSNSDDENEDGTGGEPDTPASTQVFKPDYYTWDFNGFVGATSAPESRSTNPPENKDFYLGYNVSNGVVSEAFACFVRSGKEYCLKGYDTTAYADNQGVIRAAFSEVADTDACAFEDYNSVCDDSSGGVGVNAYSDGYVTAGRGTAQCIVHEFGEFGCSEW